RISEQLQRGQRVPISVIPRTRATRPNALEPSAIRIYQPGTQIFPRYPVTDQQAIGNSNLEIRRVLLEMQVPLNEPQRERRFLSVPIANLVRLAQMVPIRDDDDGRWDTEAVCAVLESLGPRYDDSGVAYVRSFEPGEDRRLKTGALSGPEVDLANRQ